MSNLTTRRVAVVFGDAHHTLHMVEVRMPVRITHELPERTINVRVDIVAAEKAARIRLDELGTDHTDRDLVGVLVAQISGPEAGRIVWAEEVEVQEAVMV